MAVPRQPAELFRRRGQLAFPEAYVSVLRKDLQRPAGQGACD